MTKPTVSYSATRIIELFQEVARKGGCVGISGDAIDPHGPRGTHIACSIDVPASAGNASRYVGNSAGNGCNVGDAISTALFNYERDVIIAMCLVDPVISVWVEGARGPFEAAAREQAAGFPGRRERVRRAVLFEMVTHPWYVRTRVVEAVREAVELAADTVGVES